MNPSKLTTFLFCIPFAAMLSACGGYNPAKIGGTVSGLPSGSSVTLQNNGRESLTVSGNGGFSFSTDFFAGTSYSVAVLTQPVAGNCVVNNGYGTVNAQVDSVTDVSVVCLPAAPISGTVNGLASGVSFILKDNSSDLLTISGNGAFAFANAIPSGSSYSVTVGTQPSRQTCTVSNGSGVVGASLIVPSVTVNCFNSATIGGTVSGLAGGTGLYLKNNGADSLFISSNGGFTFATGLSSGAAYNVTISSHPIGQTCTVSGGGGTVNSNLDNVTSVAVTCVTN